MKKLIIPNEYDDDQRKLDCAIRFVFKSKPGESMYLGSWDIGDGAPLIAFYDEERGILKDLTEIEVMTGAIHVTERIFLFRTRDSYYLYNHLDRFSPFVPSDFCQITRKDAGRVLENLAPVSHDYEGYVWDLRVYNWPYSGKTIIEKGVLINDLNNNGGRAMFSYPQTVHIVGGFKSEDGRIRNLAIPGVDMVVRRDGMLIAVSLDTGLFAFDEQKYDESYR